MLFILTVAVLLVGEGLATTPIKPPIKCPLPTGPYAPPKCGLNEYFEVCSKPCPPQNCSSLWSKYACLDACCKPECRCKDGFLRNKSGVCVSVDECLFPCGPLERFVRDSTECQRTCANHKVTGPRSLCKPYTGCVCIKGRVRVNDDGTGACVLPKQCPLRKCPLFEHWEDCPSVCLKETCASKSPDYKCQLPLIPLPCKPRCVCDKGFLRDSYGNCIRENCCPFKKCPTNEVWRCTSMCTRDSCPRQDADFKCPIGGLSVCIPACACKNGFLRDDRGICVPRKLCPKIKLCGINEVAVKCATVYPPQTCESIYTLYKPVKNIPCNPGCDCRPGYLRNKFNICIPSEFCPTVPANQCGLFQEYKTCGSACEPSCADLDNPNQICTDQCVTGCFCKENYVKDDQGNCVTRDRCPLPVCNKPNEVAKECGSSCEVKTCDDGNKTHSACPAVCVRGCFCRDGYVRNPYGICVLPEQCPLKPVCLLENEEYQPCGSSCPDNCDNYKDTGRICTLNCVPACNCKAGFVRNLVDKTCVKPEQCPTKKCTGLNESLNLCASYCPVTCANRLTIGDWACATACRVACDCNPGTLRNDSGVCVNVAECTPPKCRQNEVYQQCGTACPLTCDNYKNSPLPCTKQCVADCFCAKGFVRDRNMRCVKPEDCEPICPAGEKFDQCSAHCQDTCENYKQPNRICTYQCQSGCVCEKGTVRRKDGKCVPPLECSQPTCSGDEVFDPCSAHCEDTCENHGPGRACTDICKPGCRCGSGLVRRKDGKCVKIKDCNPECPINERWVNCVIGLCIPKTCDELGYPIPCPGIIGPCEGGCVCRENYVKNSKGICIPQKDCPSCGGDFNATSGCGTNCGNLCSNYDKPNNCSTFPQFCEYNGCDCKSGYVLDSVSQRCVAPADCPIPCNGDILAERKECPSACPPTCAKPNTEVCNKACLKNGCQCRPGYILGPDRKCVKVENCPDNLGCNGDPNAIVRNCPSPCALTCENQEPRPCPAICLPPGCDCKYGYILSKPGGRCIKIEQCANNTTCTDRNAVTKKCAVAEFCRPTCAQPNPRVCPRICVVNGCECQPGHVLSEKGGKCIKIEECQLTNASCNGDPNAVIKSNPQACPSTCDAPNGFPACKKLSPAVGCECKPGYLRSKDDGKCILPDQCPGGNPCGKNATFVWCHVNCPTNECPVDDNRAIIACDPPYPCPSGCSCRLNYRRKSFSDDTCILASECPPVKCTRPNEIWSPCPSACLRENCADVNDQPTTCNPLVLNCQPQCICKKGYFRNDEDICVPAKKCPINQPCSDPNAERVECAPVCRSTCVKPNPGPCILSCKLNDCVCKKGFILSEPNGKCIPANQCPKDTPCNGDSNAVIKINPISCPSTCSEPNADPYCKRHAPEVGCECKPGFLKSTDDIDGKCIQPDTCPGGNPCGPNGTFVWCNVNCPTNNCPVSDRTALIACSPPFPCPNGCACKVNYRRKSSTNKQCILASDCPPVNCTRPNEEWSPCPSACLAENCADVNNQPTTCNTLILNCQPRCICKKGHFRNSNGICVPAKQCPKPIKCKANEVYSPCSIQCPPQTCASTYTTYNCDMAPPCQPGCDCISEYLRNGTETDICIPSSQCPGPIKKPCSDPNAERVECAPVCRSTCAKPDPGPCVLSCKLNDCVCKKGFILSEPNGKCIPANQCPKNQSCSDPNAERLECAPAPSCRSTCSVPNPGPCVLSCAINECVCKNGYVLSKKGGKCIPVEQCPIQTSCNGDPNAVIKSCPLACPATCDAPNAIPCRRACDPVGCECKDGYILSDSAKTGGQCIRPEKCQGGSPCGKNETYASCKVNCPSDYCPVTNTPNRVVCELPNPCYPGCVCKINYRRRSVQDQRCMYASECPPVKCDKNEVWSGCPSECLAEDCANVNDPPVTCNTLLLNCQPKCICKKGYFRDRNRRCIPANQCPKPIKCKANEVYNPCSINCPPQTCASIYSSYDCSKAPPCKPGCDCISEYLRNGTETDLCIPSSQCPGPTPACGLNEHYEVNRKKCDLTCKTKDLQAQIGPCHETSGCFCDHGYVRNNSGICVLLKQCPKPIICPANEVVSECYNACLTTCRTRIRGDGRQCHLSCGESGCVCKSGYLRHDNGTCVSISECSPPRCNENETYSKCGTACPKTCQNRGDNCTVCTAQCVEGCFCNKGLVRADDECCIAPKYCPPRTCDDPDKYFDECPPSCPGTDGCSLLWSKFNCTGAVQCCKPQCRCTPGLYRGPSGACITAKQCISKSTTPVEPTAQE